MRVYIETSVSSLRHVGGLAQNRLVPLLSDRDQTIIEFEAAWTRGGGAKEALIRDRFGLSYARYYQLVNRILDDPVALAAMPFEVKRLRRLHSERVRARSCTIVRVAMSRAYSTEPMSRSEFEGALQDAVRHLITSDTGAWSTLSSLLTRIAMEFDEAAQGALIVKAYKEFERGAPTHDLGDEPLPPVGMRTEAN